MIHVKSMRTNRSKRKLFVKVKSYCHPAGVPADVILTLVAEANLTPSAMM